MVADSITVGLIYDILGRAAEIGTGLDHRRAPALAVWARAGGADPLDRDAGAELVRNVVKALSDVQAAIHIELAGTPGADVTLLALVELLNYLTLADLSRPAVDYFSDLPANWRVTLESCRLALGAESRAAVPEVVLDTILERTDQLEAAVRAARHELGPDGAKFLSSLLVQVRAAVDECLVGGPAALADLVDRLSGQTTRRRNLLSRIAGHPVTVEVTQLVAALAAVVAVAQGHSPSEPTWYGPPLPPADVTVICSLEGVEAEPPGVTELPPSYAPRALPAAE